MLALAHFTGWQPSEIENMRFEDFAMFVNRLPRDK